MFLQREQCCQVVCAQIPTNHNNPDAPTYIRCVHGTFWNHRFCKKNRPPPPRPCDRRLPLIFVQLVMALWLVDITQFPAYFSIMLAELSEDPILEGHLDTVAVEAFGNWVSKMTTSSQVHYVNGAGAFKQKFAALMARARVVRLEPGAALARYLREEVLAAKSAEAASSHRLSARSSALASHIATTIHGLEVVLTTICEAMESRVAELTKSGAAVGAVTTAPARRGSPVIAGGEKAGTIAGHGVTAAAAAGVEEQGSVRREESRREVDVGKDAEQQRRGGEGTVAGTPAAVAETVPAANHEPRPSSSPTSGRDAAAQRGDNDEPSGDMSTLVSEAALSAIVLATCGISREPSSLNFRREENAWIPLVAPGTHDIYRPCLIKSTISRVRDIHRGKLRR